MCFLKNEECAKTFPRNFVKPIVLAVFLMQRPTLCDVVVVDILVLFTLNISDTKFESENEANIVQV